MSSNKPLILITNDDSIHAKGLWALVDMMKPFGDLFVVAPMYPQSCKSQAVSIKDPLRVNKLKEEEGMVVYACSGTPVDCVKVAMGALLPRHPDLLVSGINHGTNSSVNVVYSGTVGAAAEGVFFGIPAIAFSLCSFSADADFSGTIPYGRAIVQQAIEKGIPHNSCLNVNFPYLPANEIKGVRMCRQNKGSWDKTVACRKDLHGDEYFWINGGYINSEPNANDTDEAALAAGYVSVVPIHYDLTDYNTLGVIQDSWGDLDLKIANHKNV